MKDGGGRNHGEFEIGKFKSKYLGVGGSHKKS
jgi:hypothetical protein